MARRSGWSEETLQEGAGAIARKKCRGAIAREHIQITEAFLRSLHSRRETPDIVVRLFLWCLYTISFGTQYKLVQKQETRRRVRLTKKGGRRRV